MSPTPTTAREVVPAGQNSSDRRVHQRYPIILDVEYKMRNKNRIQRQGFCQTLNISSGGVLLHLKDALPSLGPIELSISWPFLLNGSVRLKLLARGKVVRVAGRSFAVKVAEHEFRTAGHEELACSASKRR